MCVNDFLTTTITFVRVCSCLDKSNVIPLIKCFQLIQNMLINCNFRKSWTHNKSISDNSSTTI